MKTLRYNKVYILTGNINSCLKWKEYLIKIGFDHAGFTMQ